MNNNRLSTPPPPPDVPKIDWTLLLQKVANLLLGSNYRSKEGKVWTVSLNRFKYDNTSKSRSISRKI